MIKRGFIENAITQHRTVRAVHGWIDIAPRLRYVCVFHPSKPYLFKIIYRYARPDLARAGQVGQGFVAEIVYGADQITAGLPVQEPAIATVLLDDATIAGALVCENAVQQALTTAHERGVAEA
ncbi:hypothetical protein [Acidocella sp. KAb 2-4]|uniref:hypothetical protein n=1 Tax=Acidocella sp. KAb 2-4 TaxID=2885158 RepID=UPI001D081B81|nr:hypothetical protein [Acidocella sp. KAb 2-4]MCB5944212.1 hypothetical protein [Acidocella sp. KAb 2-4]